MSEGNTLEARPRSVTGKQVKRLRAQGVLPANVYGRGIESVSIETDAREFSRFIRTSAVRGMFQLKIDGEDSPRHVILRGLSRKGGTGEPIHADFFQVDVNRPVQTTVPLLLAGEAPAVRDLAGTLVQSLETVSIRCLPLSIPAAVDVELGLLKSFTASITIGDLTPPAGVEILGDPAVVVASVSPPRIRKADEG